jgi:hypothetical protein
MNRPTDEDIAKRRACAAFVDPPAALHDALDMVESERVRADLAEQQVSNVKRLLRGAWTGRVNVRDVLAALDDVGPVL